MGGKVQSPKMAFQGYTYPQQPLQQQIPQMQMYQQPGQQTQSGVQVYPQMVQQASGYQQQGQQATAPQIPFGQQAAGYQQMGQQATAYQQPGQQMPVYQQPGQQVAGYQQMGQQMQPSQTPFGQQMQAPQIPFGQQPDQQFVQGMGYVPGQQMMSMETGAAGMKGMSGVGLSASDITSGQVGMPRLVQTAAPVKILQPQSIIVIPEVQSWLTREQLTALMNIVTPAGEPLLRAGNLADNLEVYNILKRYKDEPDRIVEIIAALPSLLSTHGKKYIWSFPAMQKHIDQFEDDLYVRNIKIEMTIVDAKCGRCKHDKAYYIPVQTRGGDEATSIFFKCVKCTHLWRAQ